MIDLVVFIFFFASCCNGWYFVDETDQVRIE